MKSWLDYTGLIFLGESNHGLYFKATPPSRLNLESDVVIKLLVQDSSDAQWQSVAQEIRLLNEFDSEWIVRILETGHKHGRIYYVMEYATLGTLARPSRALSTLEQVTALSHGVKGLSLLHSKGYIHRDVRPSKILVHENGGKLNDLGIAEVNSLEENSVPTGSIGFMAPEVAKGLKASPASDFFGIGATLHLILTSQSIYPNVPKLDLMEAVEHIATVPPTIKNVKAKPHLMEIISRCLELSPDARPENAIRLGYDLELAIIKDLE